MLNPAPSGAIAPVPMEDLLSAPSMLLLGESGTGKTDSLGELASHVRKLFVIVTEPNGLEVLLDSFIRRKVPIDKLHFHVISPSRSNFEDMQKLAVTVSQSTHESLTKQHPGNRQGAKFIDVMGIFHNFTCQRTGEVFGNLSTLGSDCAVAVDSLSGLSAMAWDVTMGTKLTAHPGEWGIAMKLIDKGLLSWTSNLKCFFVMTGHVEREVDEVTQSSKLMASTLGKKLAPNIPKFFSEVVRSYTDANQFHWSTSDPSMALKHRALPFGSKLPVSYKPIVEKYQQRLALLKT